MSTSTFPVLELFSGIGGLHAACDIYNQNFAVMHSHSEIFPIDPFAKTKSGILLRVENAFDIDEAANAVYEHNFGLKVNQKDIAKLTPNQMDNFAADVWLVSAPCQVKSGPVSFTNLFSTIFSV